MNRNLILLLLYLTCLLGQSSDYIEELIIKGASYYNRGDYNNAIVVYEDLLAEQELRTDYTLISETLLRLGEMYFLLDK